MTESHKISVVINGKTYSGFYSVEGGVITVNIPEWGRTMSTHISTTKHEIEAKRLLREIVEGDPYKE